MYQLESETILGDSKQKRIGKNCSLSAIAEIQPSQNMSDMISDRTLRKKQLLSNFSIAEAAGN